MSILYHLTGEPGLQEGTSGPGPWDSVTQQNPPPTPAGGPQPFSTDNKGAIPVNQRSPIHWSGQLYNVKGAAGAATRLLTDQRGRKSFTLIVPPGAPAGVYIDSGEEGLVSSGVTGFPVAVGAGVSVDTEDELWAVSQTPGVATQVSIIVTWG